MGRHLQKLLVVVGCFFLFYQASSDTVPPLPQQHKLDSLQQVKKSTSADSVRLKISNTISEYYWKAGQYSKAKSIADKVRQKARQSGLKNIQAEALTNLGIISDYKSHYDKAVNYYNKALKIYRSIDDEKGIGDCYGNLGLIFWKKGEHDKALEFFHKALRLQKKLGQKRSQALTYNNIGIIHERQSHNKKAKKYYKKSLTLQKELDNKYGIALTYNNLGVVHQGQDQFLQALSYYRKSLRLRKEIGNKKDIAESYSNIGSIFTQIYKEDTLHPGNSTASEVPPHFKDIHLLDSAYYYQKKAFQLHKSLNLPGELTYSLMGLGNILFYKKQFEKAIPFYKRVSFIADTIGALTQRYKSFKKLSHSYKKIGHTDSALYYYKRYADLQDSAHSLKSQEKMAELEAKYEKVKRQKRIEELEEEKKVQRAQLKYNRMLLWGTGGVLLLVLVFAAILYNRFRVIQYQKGVIDKHRSVLETKNKEITDSINYAKNIQQALLKEEDHVSTTLPPHFVLLKPQATVSGDFHWSIKKGKEWYIAVADCTGHGVPGAFLTMLGTAYLNEITSKPGQITPAEILDQLRDRFIKELGENTAENGSWRLRDGMDISLLRVNLSTYKAQWAGANNPLYVIRSNERTALDISCKRQVTHEGNRLFELGPDKQPIGYTANPAPFTNNTFQLLPQDRLYQFSDGFPDQFGGPKGKKFMYKRFKRLLMDLYSTAMPEQKSQLNETIENWMAQNEEEQIDDICVMGVKII